MRPIIKRLRTWLPAVLVFIVFYSAMHAWQTRDMASGMAPEVSFTQSDNSHAMRLNEWRMAHAGEPTVLYFWATWCAVCHVEQPLISQFVQQYPVLPVAMQSGNATQVAQFEQQHGLLWHSAIDSQGDIAKAFGIAGTPSFVVLDANGRISSRTIGITSPWGLRARLLWARLSA